MFQIAATITPNTDVEFSTLPDLHTPCNAEIELTDFSSTWYIDVVQDSVRIDFYLYEYMKPRKLIARYTVSTDKLYLSDVHIAIRKMVTAYTKQRRVNV